MCNLDNNKTMVLSLFTFRDELPIKLALPAAIQKAQTNQELTAIALQGQGIVLHLFVCLSVCLSCRITEDPITFEN